MKLDVGVKLESDVKKYELFARLLEIEGVKKIKKLTDTSIELETERRLDNKDFTQKDINDKVIKLLEDDYAGIKEITSIVYQD